MRCTLLSISVIAVLGSAEFAPPQTWTQRSGNPLVQAGQAAWRFDQVWPAKFTNPANFVPMVWQTGRHTSWGAAEHGFGGQPTGSANKDGIVFSVRGPRTDAQPCMTALAFIPAKAGNYQVSGVLDVSRWEGQNAVAFTILRRNVANGLVAMVQECKPEAKAGNAIAASTALAAGEELFLVASVPGFNTAAVMTLRDLRIVGP